jgi:hypothetical protein
VETEGPDRETLLTNALRKMIIVQETPKTWIILKADDNGDICFFLQIGQKQNTFSNGRPSFQ